jgi:hypothetical protein
VIVVGALVEAQALVLEEVESLKDGKVVVVIQSLMPIAVDQLLNVESSLMIVTLFVALSLVSDHSIARVVVVKVILPDLLKRHMISVTLWLNEKSVVLLNVQIRAKAHVGVRQVAKIHLLEERVLTQKNQILKREVNRK